MKDSTHYRDALTEADGTCRDINFAPLTLADCRTIAERVFSCAEKGSATDGNGNAVALDAAAFLSAGTSTPFVHAGLANVSAVFSELQCFFCVEDGSPFWVLTFCPEHIFQHGDPLTTVVRFLSNICEGTDVTEYFVRYENAAWKFGDITSGSGVILTRSQVAVIHDRL